MSSKPEEPSKVKDLKLNTLGGGSPVYHGPPSPLFGSSSPVYNSPTSSKFPTSPTPLSPTAQAEQEKVWRSELAQDQNHHLGTDLSRLREQNNSCTLESEIQSLRTVISNKTGEAAELKRKLGKTAIGELTEDIKQGFQTIKASEPVQKTNAAFKSFGEFASKKLDDIKNSTAFKSVEGKVEDAYTNIKKRISTRKSESEGILEDVNMNEELKLTDKIKLTSDGDEIKLTGDDLKLAIDDVQLTSATEEEKIPEETTIPL